MGVGWRADGEGTFEAFQLTLEARLDKEVLVGPGKVVKFGECVWRGVRSKGSRIVEIQRGWFREAGRSSGNVSEDG